MTIRFISSEKNYMKLESKVKLGCSVRCQDYPYVQDIMSDNVYTSPLFSLRVISDRKVYILGKNG